VQLAYPIITLSPAILADSLAHDEGELSAAHSSSTPHVFLFECVVPRYWKKMRGSTDETFCTLHDGRFPMQTAAYTRRCTYADARGRTSSRGGCGREDQGGQ
jgi:hypothetical protein